MGRMPGNRIGAKFISAFALESTGKTPLVSSWDPGNFEIRSVEARL
jgi:formaldehyde-activating enzyme involved in methanogenesis